MLLRELLRDNIDIKEYVYGHIRISSLILREPANLYMHGLLSKSIQIASRNVEKYRN